MRARFLWIPALVLAGCSSQPNTPGKEEAKGSGAAAAAPKPNITMFYANPPAIPRGEKGTLCYGVEFAESLTLDPPVDRVWPSVSRCIDITPSAETTYTLTAKNAAGETSKKVTVPIGSPSVRLVEVQVNALTIKSGEPLQLCWTARNAVSIEILGKNTQGQSPNKGCIVDHPKRDVTYSVRVRGAAGDVDSETVTVKVASK